MKFPQEQSTTADFTLWTNTIRHLTSSTLTLSPPPGKFLCTCPKFHTWQTNNTQSYIVHREDNTTYRVYYPLQNTIRVRSHTTFQYHHTTTQPPSCNLTALVIRQSIDNITLHSINNMKQHTNTHKEPFLSKQRKGSPKQLWHGMNIDNDREWIIQAIKRGTLLIVHDGSFMPHKDKSICSAGKVLLFTQLCHIGAIKTV